MCSQLKGPACHCFFKLPFFSCFHGDITIRDRDINHWINYCGPPSGSRRGVSTLIKRQREWKRDKYILGYFKLWLSYRGWDVKLVKVVYVKERGNYNWARGQNYTGETGRNTNTVIWEATSPSFIIIGKLILRHTRYFCYLFDKN